MFRPQETVLRSAGNILSSTTKVEMPAYINHDIKYTLRDKHLSSLSIRQNPSDIKHLMKLKIVGFCWKQSTKSSLFWMYKLY